MDLERYPSFNALLSSGLDARTARETLLRRVRITNVLTLVVLTLPFVVLSVVKNQPVLTVALLALIAICAGSTRP